MCSVRTMEEIILLAVKILGGALGTVLFYRLGFKFLSKFRLVDKEKNYSKRFKYWTSEITQFLIFIVFLGIVILFNRYVKG